MVGSPETYYARDGKASVAYQVVGTDGPDLLFAAQPLFPIDLIWDDPTVARHLHRLASFSRLILTDLAGTGSSDEQPTSDRPAMQVWTDGLTSVLDAVGSSSASLFTTAGAALPGLMLAASRPQRVRSLVMWNPFARYLSGPDQPFGYPESQLPAFVERFRDAVGTGQIMDRLAPSWSNDAAKRHWWARCERLSGGPAKWKANWELYARTDARPLLDSVQAPALLMRRRGDRDIFAEHLADLAKRLPQARIVEFEGDDSLWFAGDTDPVIDEIESFVAGVRSPKPSNRVLSTVLFTDIVGSTERAAQLGDEAWAATLVAHDQLIARHVAAARGVYMKSTGDGALATFDGPARAIDCARAIRDSVGSLGLSIRAGLHTGEVEMADHDVHGIAVHIAARIMSLAGADEVLVSGVMPPLVLGAQITFEDRGQFELKGVPGAWRIYAVDGSRG
jgi:class 3 adenylate cyclase